MKRILLLLIICLYSNHTLAAFALESRGNSCQLKTSISLPSLDLSCDADTRSGNASSWLNPNSMCDMSFEMLNLPSLGDLTAGVTAKVCTALKGLKAMTYDQAIKKINSEVPDDVLGGLDLNLDLNEKVSVSD